jgi:type I restriction enzyme, S subunit
MAKQVASTVVPKLRFPEFRNVSEWTTVQLRKLSEFVTERVGTTHCVPYTVTSGVGLVSQQEKLGRTIAGNSLKNYIVLQRNDFAYNKSATKAFPQGFIARYVGDDRAAVPNSIFTCFRTNDDVIDPTYLDNLFATNLHGNWLRNRIAVGARAHGSLNVSDEDLMDLLVPLPGGASSLDEQQKIADCLTSLDEVITAQGRKVEALKRHKRGLMQRLFPREGETRPRLRFPEFRNAAEWDTRRFFDLFEDVLDFRGRTPKKLGMEWGGGNIISLSANNVKDGFIDYNAECYLGSEELHSRWMAGANLERGDIVFTMEAPLGKALLVPDERKYILSQRVVAFKTKSDVINEFLIQLIWSDIFQGAIGLLATGSTAKGISQKSLQRLLVSLPKEDEQRRIAQCLAPVDTQIAAETGKLSALKSHKQGLMQQLFPAPESG